MDIIEAVTTRKSMRYFKPDPIPRALLSKILEEATRAPSWANTQPWEFAIFGGEVMEEMRKAYLEHFELGAEPCSDIPEPKWPEPYSSRMRVSSRKLRIAYGIDPEDKGQLRKWTIRGYNFFGAPNGIIIYMDKKLGPWSLLDVGSVMTIIQLLAHNYGLGCCTQMQMIRWPDIIRKLMNIPDSKKIIIGIAIGYPDREDITSRYTSERVPLEQVVTWHGI